ncbi:MAG: hypothetical protein U5P10_00080 [Spirochaetia bacterium]|nr:hypothetical protein [Spirochaetia bacterium]
MIIDAGLMTQDELMDDGGNELSTKEIRNIVLDALKDDRFVKRPKLFTNCVRVYYSETDEEKHHVDFPIYRSFENGDGLTRELGE